MRIWCVALALLLAPVVARAQAADPLAGAWEQTSNRNVTTNQAQQLAPPALHVIFSGGQYVQFRAAANRAKSDTPREKMTREQLLERGNIAGQYGTYRVAGTKLTRRIVSAADPNNEGREVTADFKVEGDTLTITAPNLQGQTTEQRFRRLR